MRAKTKGECGARAAIGVPMSAAPLGGLLTMADLAALLQRSVRTLQRELGTGLLPPAVNLGTAARPVWRWRPADVERWLEQRRPS